MSKVPKIEYTYLGRTGLKVSNICLGAMTFGSSNEEPMGPIFFKFFSNPKQLNEAESHRILDRFVELGGNFIDTANVYSAGMSEKIVGTWLKRQNRDGIVVATKVRFPSDWSKPNSTGLSRRTIFQACGESLERLQTNYIDLYQAHMWDNATATEETLRAFDDLVRIGKIRYYGFSNVCGWQLQKIVDTTKHLNLNPCVSLQQQYNLIERQSELEAFMVCENEGMCVLPWSPLNWGMLSGKFKRDETPDPVSSRIGYLQAKSAEGKPALCKWNELNNDENYWKTIAVLEKIARLHGSPPCTLDVEYHYPWDFAQHVHYPHHSQQVGPIYFRTPRKCHVFGVCAEGSDKTVPEVAIRWLIQKKVVSSVIIGCTSVKQLEENMGASAGWELTTNQMKELNETHPVKKPYPYDFIWGVHNSTRMNRFNDSLTLL